MKATESRICLSCLHDVEVISATTFLGFRRFMCPRCQTVQKHPLNTARKVFYIVFVATIGTLCAYLVSRGEVPVPGVLPILTAIALFSNTSISAAVRDARRRQATRAMQEASLGRLGLG